MGKIKVGRKVQAQRKFAQGAYIPSTNNNALDRASRVSDVTNQDLHIHQSNMKASNLLDVVTFHRLHLHANPVVCLNRIDLQRKNDDNSIDNTFNETGRHNRISPPLNITQTILSESRFSSLDITVKEKPSINCSPYSLETPLSTRKKKSNETDNNMTTKKRTSATPAVSGRSTSTTSNKDSVINEDTDDDRPLKYYMKKRKSVGMKRTQTRTSRLIRPKIITRSSKCSVLRKSQINISLISPKRSMRGGPDKTKQPIRTSRTSENSKQNVNPPAPVPKTTGKIHKKNYTVKKVKKSSPKTSLKEKPQDSTSINILNPDKVAQTPPVVAKNICTDSPLVLSNEILTTSRPCPSITENETHTLLETPQKIPLAQPPLGIPSPYMNISSLSTKAQEGKQEKTGVIRINRLQLQDQQELDVYNICNWLSTMMPKKETKKLKSPKTLKRTDIVRCVDGQSVSRPMGSVNPNVYDFDGDDYDTEPRPSLSGFRQATRAFNENTEQHKSRTIYLDPRLSSIPNHVIQIGMPEKKEWMARLVPLSEVKESNISMIQDDSLFDHMNSTGGDVQKTLDDMHNRPSTSGHTSLQSTKPHRTVPKAKDTVERTHVSYPEQHQGSQTNSDANKPSNKGVTRTQTFVNLTIKEEEIVISDDEEVQNVMLEDALPGVNLTTAALEPTSLVQVSQASSNVTEAQNDVQSASVPQSSTLISNQKKKPQNVKFYLDPTFTSSQESQIIEITSIGEHLHARLMPASQIDTNIPMINYQTSYDQMVSNDVANSKVQDESTSLPQSQDDQQISGCATSSTNLVSITSNLSCKRSNSQRITCKQQASYLKTTTKAKVVEAPVFHPTNDELKDPISYFEIMKPMLKKFGLGKVVTPPGFPPSCILDDQMRFCVVNQYIGKMYSRWGPISREMCTIRAHLATQGVVFTRAPLLDGIEVNLSKLYHVVQRHGGLKDVIQKKRWSKVAEEMGLPKGPKLEKKLDQIYLKYLVPYDTLSSKERQQKMATVEQLWNKKYKRMLDRALNPLHRQSHLLEESESSDEENDEELTGFEGALKEAEDCVVPGRNMNLATFKKIAEKMIRMRWPNSTPSTERIEAEYWNVMQMGSDHECVYSASVDTKHGYGFPNSELDPGGKHPWNLKMLSKNKGNVLRFLNSVPGVSTLHLGMMHSTSCLHRDPHGLPFTEYLHEGSPKIWYGIPEDQSENFRKAVETLCPSYCQNKEVWLPSDIAMIPPNQLIERNVALTRVEQHPGEFILVYPQAYSCSICTGYTVSESAYFATKHWLDNAYPIFQNLRDSCEPTMFPLEQLLLSAGKDPTISNAVLQRVYAPLCTIVWEELEQRRALERLGIPSQRHIEKPGDKRRPPSPRSKPKPKAQQSDECEICRATLYLSHVTGITDVTSPMCIQHALHVINSPKFKGRSLSSIDLTCFYSAAELETLLHNVQKKLESVLSSEGKSPALSAVQKSTPSTRRNTTI